jgi:hypothetical protein
MEATSSYETLQVSTRLHYVTFQKTVTFIIDPVEPKILQVNVRSQIVKKKLHFLWNPEICLLRFNALKFDRHGQQFRGTYCFHLQDTYYLDDGEKIFLRNIGTPLPKCMVSHFKRA